MSSSIPVFETTHHKSNEWVGDVAGELDTDDRHLAYRILRGVLHTLRDRLTPEEAVHLGAQQPGVPDPERWARCVFAVLSRRIDAGEIQDVIGILPDALADLWPESVRA